MRYEYTDGKNADFIALCGELDDYLNRLVGGEENRREYVQYNKTDDIDNAIVAYDGDVPAGGAAFKRYDSKRAEVKRVFVRREYRERGTALKLMTLLEKSAKSEGYDYLILETGEPLVEAMRLYKKIGFEIIDNYGQYKDMPDSVCMMKKL